MSWVELGMWHSLQLHEDEINLTILSLCLGEVKGSLKW